LIDYINKKARPTVNAHWRRFSASSGDLCRRDRDSNSISRGKSVREAERHGRQVRTTQSINRAGRPMQNQRRRSNYRRNTASSLTSHARSNARYRIAQDDTRKGRRCDHTSVIDIRTIQFCFEHIPSGERKVEPFRNVADFLVSGWFRCSSKSLDPMVQTKPMCNRRKVSPVAGAG
jgi:hypothetical protein